VHQQLHAVARSRASSFVSSIAVAIEQRQIDARVLDRID
jgi:hypothetical protein